MSVSLKDTTIGGFATLDGTETKADIVRFVRSQVQLKTHKSKQNQESFNKQREYTGESEQQLHNNTNKAEETTRFNKPEKNKYGINQKLMTNTGKTGAGKTKPKHNEPKQAKA